MERGVEEPLTAALGRLAAARILFDVGNQTGIELSLSRLNHGQPGVQAPPEIVGSVPITGTSRFKG